MNNSLSLGIGVYLISFLVSILVVSSLVFFIGWHITPFIMVASWLIAILSFKLVGFSQKETFISFGISTIIIVISIFLCSFVMDVSYDGNAYHQPIIYALANGWNPVYYHHNPIIGADWNMNIWIDHYCKGAEIIAAGIYSVTGNIETGKALNLILPTATFFLVLYFLRNIFIVKLTCFKSVVYSLGLAFTMIVMRQITSFYIDYIGYFTFLIAVISAYLIYKGEQARILGQWGLFCCIVISASVKFNMLFWTGFIVLCLVLLLVLKKEIKKAFWVALFCFFIAVVSILTVAYNPLVTNTLDHHNPVFPLGDKTTGAGNAPAECAQPPYVLKAPLYMQIFYGYTQRPSNDIGVTRYLSPYIISKDNISNAGFCDARLGGGGFFFVELLLLTLIVILFFYRSHRYCYFLFFELSLVATLFILPMGSLFRYVPFIYLLPFAALLYLEDYKKSIAKEIVYYAISFLLLCNITLCTAVTLYKNYKYQKGTESVLKEIHNHKNFYTKNWGFCNKLNKGDMLRKRPINPIYPEEQYSPQEFVGGPKVYVKNDY